MNIPVYSIVAFSGTGKTTLLEKLIPELKSRGLRVAVIKHDAHEFQIDREGKDTWRMTNAGADITAVTNASHAAVLVNRPVSFDVLLSMITDVDIILTEGYKHGSWPKIALFRKASGNPLPISENGYFAIMSDTDTDVNAPCLPLDDIAGLTEMILADIK